MNTFPRTDRKGCAQVSQLDHLSTRLLITIFYSSGILPPQRRWHGAEDSTRKNEEAGTGESPKTAKSMPLSGRIPYAGSQLCLGRPGAVNRALGDQNIVLFVSFQHSLSVPFVIHVLRCSIDVTMPLRLRSNLLTAAVSSHCPSLKVFTDIQTMLKLPKIALLYSKNTKTNSFRTIQVVASNHERSLRRCAAQSGGRTSLRREIDKSSNLVLLLYKNSGWEHELEDQIKHLHTLLRTKSKRTHQYALHYSPRHHLCRPRCRRSSESIDRLLLERKC